MVSFEELLEAVQAADPDEIRRDSQRAEEQWLQRAADSPVSGKAAPYSSRQDQSEAALRPDAIDSGLLERNAAQPDHLHEHRNDAGAGEGDIATTMQRFIDQLGQSAQGDGSELAELLRDVDPDVLRARIDHLGRQQRQRTEDHPAPVHAPDLRQQTHSHAQEKSAAYHQQRPSSGLT
ncbi:hypothetical protein ACFYY1_35515 [Streptomyces sp. NPDC001890]|uniref:hypothetical protein n=1 Tax=Streptomyces sp. NPDC001890 TaxID=3364620 RepID=UPI00367ECF86